VVNIVTWFSDSRRFFGIDDRIYWTLWYSAWVHYYTHTHTIVSTVTSSLPLLGSGFNGRRSSSSGFPNYPRPQLPASNSKSSQWLSRSSSLTDSLTNSTDCNKVKVKTTLRQAVYRQSVRLGAKPLEFTTRDFFFATESLQPYFLRNILSDEKMGLSPMNMLGLSSSVRIAHIACCWKFFVFHYTQILCQYRLYRADHACIAYLILQRQLRHWNVRKLHHRQV
jgi:hypothetical protein